SVYSFRFIKKVYNSATPTHFELSINLQLVTRDLKPAIYY
ncbi:unnamed protein product, partial [marine sediment metagenome]